MEAIVKLNKWANAHTSIAWDMARVGLGIFLFYKGIAFLDQSQMLVEMLAPVKRSEAMLWVVHYVAPVHLVGGLFIAIGLLTRLAALFQLPILLGAVWVHLSGIDTGGSLIIASVTLLALLFFLFFGSGKHSVDYTMKLNM